MVKHEMFSVCESKQPLGVRLASLWAICFYGRLVSHTHTLAFFIIFLDALLLSQRLLPENPALPSFSLTLSI